MKRKDRWDMAQIIANVIGVGIVPLVSLVLLTPAAQQWLQQKTQQSVVETNRILAGLEITYPTDGAEVDSQKIVVKGKTPFTTMRHMLAVTPLKRGGEVLQDEPVTVNPDGTWDGRVTLGSASVGRGERFAIRVVAIRGDQLWGRIPADALSSTPIIVTRTE